MLMNFKTHTVKAEIIETLSCDKQDNGNDADFILASEEARLERYAELYSQDMLHDTLPSGSYSIAPFMETLIPEELYYLTLKIRYFVNDVEYIREINIKSQIANLQNNYLFVTYEKSNPYKIVNIQINK